MINFNLYFASFHDSNVTQLLLTYHLWYRKSATVFRTVQYSTAHNMSLPSCFGQNERVMLIGCKAYMCLNGYKSIYLKR